MSSTIDLQAMASFSNVAGTHGAIYWNPRWGQQSILLPTLQASTYKKERNRFIKTFVIC